MKKFWLFKAIANLLFAMFTGLATLKFAIVQNPIIGRASGNVGKTRFSVWKGINYIASIGLKEDRKKQYLSTAVIANRLAMQVIGHAIKQIKVQLKIAFLIQIYGSTPFAKVVQYFRKKWSTSDGQLDTTKFPGTSFGSNTEPSQQYNITDAAKPTFSITVDPTTRNNNFGATSYLDIIVFTDTLLKIHSFPNLTAATNLAEIPIPFFSDYFDTGDNVAILSCLHEVNSLGQIIGTSYDFCGILFTSVS